MNSVGRKYNNRRIVAILLAFAMILSNFVMPSVAKAEGSITVAEAIENNVGQATVKGYIVGYARSGTSYTFEAPFGADTNIGIADSATERDVTKIMPVRMATQFRPEFGLLTNPDKLGQFVEINGSLGAYFGVPGITGINTIVNSEATDPGQPVDPEEPVDPEVPTDPEEPADPNKITLSFNTSEWTGEEFSQIVLTRRTYSPFTASLPRGEKLPVPSNTETHFFANWEGERYHQGATSFGFVNGASQYDSDSTLTPVYYPKLDASFYMTIGYNTGSAKATDESLIKFEVQDENGQVLNTSGLGIANRVPMEEGNYKIVVKGDTLRQAGIEIESMFAYKRDRIEDLNTSSQSQIGDLSKVEILENGDVVFDYEAIKTVRQVNGGYENGSHTMLIWMTVNAVEAEAPVPEEYKLTIDTSEEGVEIAEGQSEHVADADGNVTIPYTFQSKLAKEGNRLVGYEVVEGTVLYKGEEVTELGLYDRTIVIESDAVLKPLWEATTGKVILNVYGENGKQQAEIFTVKITDEEGNVVEFSSDSYSLEMRRWEAEKLENGTYTIEIEGLDGKYISDVVAQGHPDVQENSTFVLNEDGTITANIKYVDSAGYANSFFRLNVYLEEITSDLGVEVRGLDNKRTTDVEFVIRDSEGIVFEGEYNEYGQYKLDKLKPGDYTLEVINLAEGTKVVINETVANQIGVATEDANIFSFTLTGEEESRQYVALKVQEAEVPVEIVSGHILSDYNVRSEASTNGDILDVLPRGQYVEGTRIEGSNWIEINHNGQVAYIYLDAQVDQVYEDGYSLGVNLRKEPNSSSEIVREIPRGKAIVGEIYGLNPNWLEVKENGNTVGYVYRDYITLEGIRVTGYSQGVNIRSRANANSQIIGVLPRGYQVTGYLDGTNPNWVRIIFNNKIGYVYKDYLQNNPITLKYTTPYDMNLRLTPNGEILRVVEGGQNFNATIHGENYNWYKINVNGQEGFVYTAQ